MSENYKMNANVVDETTPEFLEMWENKYEKNMTRQGRLTTLLAALLTFIPALYLWLILGYIPTWSQIGAGWATVATAYALLYFVEPLSYFPAMGLSGIYIGYLAGNIPSVRLPAMLAAQDATGAKAGTKRGELVGTIAIGCSVFVNLAFVTLAAIAGGYILAVLPPFVTKAFDFTLPGILGGVMGQYFVENSPVLVVVMITLCLCIQYAPIPSIFKFPLAILMAFIVGVVLYKNKKAKEAEKAAM